MKISATDAAAGNYSKVSVSLGEAKLTKKCGQNGHSLRLYLRDAAIFDLFSIYSQTITATGGTQVSGEKTVSGIACTACGGAGRVK